MPYPGRWLATLAVPFTSLAVPLAALVGAALGSAGCNRPAADGSADGKEVFAYACANCHGPQGTPPASMAAQLGVRDLRSAEFRARATPALVEHQVRTGSKNTLMPSFASALSDAQIRAVSLFVAGGFEPPAPTAPPGVAAGAAPPSAPAPAPTKPPAQP